MCVIPVAILAYLENGRLGRTTCLNNILL